MADQLRSGAHHRAGRGAAQAGNSKSGSVVLVPMLSSCADSLPLTEMVSSPEWELREQHLLPCCSSFFLQSLRSGSDFVRLRTPLKERR